MGRYLCVVRRDDPLLQGYVRVALSERMSDDDDVEIIVDRRYQVTSPGDAPDRVERRRRTAAQRRLNEEGYVLVALDDRAGALPAAAARRQERRAPVPWRGLVTVGACLALVVTAAFALTSSNRVAGSLWGLASGWSRPVGAAIDAVAGLSIWSRERPSPSPATPVTPRIPAPAEPRGELPPVRSERPPAEAGITPGPAAEDQAQVTPSKTLDAPSPVLPPRTPEKPSGALVSRPAHAPSGPAGSAAVPATLPPPTGVSRAASTAGFPGVPEVQVEWHKARDGNATAYAARLRDEAGHPLAASEVTLLVRPPGETMREVPLSGTGDPGTYQGRMPGAGPDPDDLRVRVVLDGKRVEIPTVVRRPDGS